MWKKYLLFLIAMFVTCCSFASIRVQQIGNSGSSAYGYRAPYGNYSSNSITQTIYTSTELVWMGKIKSIEYYVASPSTNRPNYNGSIKIYMGHKSTTIFSSSADYMTTKNLKLVYSGRPTLGTQEGWEKITLDTPFTYNGVDNLVIVVCKTGYPENQNLKYYYATKSSGTLYRMGSSSAYADLSSSSYGYTVSSYRPLTKVSIDAFEDIDIWNGTTGAHKFYDSGSNTVYYRFKSQVGTTFTATCKNRCCLDGEELFGQTRDNFTSEWFFNYCSDYRVCQIKFNDNATHIVEIPANSTDIIVKHPTTNMTETVRDITLSKAGDLKYYITNEDKYYIRKLTVSGPINEDDLILIRQMAGCEKQMIDGGSYMGELTSLDMTNAYFSPSSDYAVCGYRDIYDDYYPIYLSNASTLEDELHCLQLTELTLPKCITRIGQKRNMSLGRLTTLTLPEGMNLEVVSSSWNLNKLSRINIASIEQWLNIVFWDIYSNPLYSGYVSGTKPNLYLPNNQIVSNLIIPESCTKIHNYAFAGCTGITSVEINGPKESIGREAFRDCVNLRNVTFKGKVDMVYSQAFEGCTGINKVITTDLQGWCETDFEPSQQYVATGATWYDSDECVTGDITVSRPCATSNPCWYAKNLYYNNQIVKNLTIPEETSKIGSSAFINCQGIQSVTYGPNVYSVGALAFYNCPNLAQINTGDLSAYCAIDFNKYLCYKYTIYMYGQVPNGQYDIYDLYNSSITTYESKNLSPYFPSSPIVYYDNEPISGSLRIPEGANKVGSYVFEGNKSLTEIVLPSTLEVLSGNAFSGCNNIERFITLAENPPLVVNGTIVDVPSSLYVPSGCIESYKSASGWNNFTNYYEYGKWTINDGQVFNLDVPMPDYTISYTRTFNNTTWQALYVPFSIPFDVLEENGLQVAKLNDTHMYDRDDDGVFEEVTIEFLRLTSGKTKANMPYLIRALEAGEKQIVLTNVELKAAAETSIDCSTTKKLFTFSGTYSGVDGETMFANHYYAISGGALKPAANSSVSLKPQRWYMKIENRDGSPMEYNASSIRLMVNGEWAEEMEEETSGLQTIGLAPTEFSFYTLEGLQVHHATRPGLYVQNGKKIVVRK